MEKKKSKVSKPEHFLRLQNAAPCREGCSELAGRREEGFNPWEELHVFAIAFALGPWKMFVVFQLISLVGK